jgi:hypothetical protein
MWRISHRFSLSEQSERFAQGPCIKKLSTLRNTAAILRAHYCYRLAGEFACSRVKRGALVIMDKTVLTPSSAEFEQMTALMRERLRPSPTRVMANWLRLCLGLNGVKDEQRVPTIFIK